MNTTALQKFSLFTLFSLSALCFSQAATANDKNTAVGVEHAAGSIPDLRHEPDVKTKKRKFFNALRPMVRAENQRIAEQRKLVLELQKKNTRTKQEQQQVSALLKTYRLKRNKNGTTPWVKLLKRVDTIPLELVLSQAANESAWGTSRFARKANNLFGQWCFTKGCGIVPSRRNPGTSHEVASFKSPQASVRSYLRNLNTGRVYKDLRDIRAKKRAADQAATASQLAEGLSKYSERGEAYVKEIKSMIKYNGKYMRGES